MLYGIQISSCCTILYVSEKARHKTVYTIGFHCVKETQGIKRKKMVGSKYTIKEMMIPYLGVISL